jgi:sarcosine oxidase, subunit gamma
MRDCAPAIESSSGRTAIVELGSRACINLRGDASDTRFVRAFADATGLALPAQPGSTFSHRLESVLWLGPDEWLIVSETQACSELAPRMRRSLQGLHAAVIDVSDASVVYAVSGSHARHVLAKGCPLDFHPSAFSLGQCARSLLAQVPILIHLRSAERGFELYVARSVGEYVRTWLRAAAREHLQAP